MIGQHKRDIRIVPYQVGWVDLFKQEAFLLKDALGSAALQVEHIGSTAIPGIAAKPVIDIMIAVFSLDQSVALIPRLESLGYIYRPNDTVPQRMFFAKESKPEYRTHHLNLTEMGSTFWVNQLVFRETLRKHPQVAEAYVDLKVRLAEAYAKTGVLDRDGKTAFVTAVLERAG